MAWWDGTFQITKSLTSGLVLFSTFYSCENAHVWYKHIYLWKTDQALKICVCVCVCLDISPFYIQIVPNSYCLIILKGNHQLLLSRCADVFVWCLFARTIHLQDVQKEMEPLLSKMKSLISCQHQTDNVSTVFIFYNKWWIDGLYIIT